MTRDARDLLPLFNVMAGTHEEKRDIRNRKVFLLEDPRIRLCSRSSADQQRAVQRAGEILKDAGMHLEYWDFLDFQNAVNIYTGTLAAESEVNLQDLIGGGTRPRLRREIPLTAQRKGIHTAPALLLSLGERFIRPSSQQIEKFVMERDQMLKRINQVLGEDGVLIMPTLPQTAPRHNHSMLRPFDMMFTGIFNVLEVPVTSAPMGVGPHGVPLGVQIIGAAGQDALTMSVAEALQEAQGGWQIPPLVKR
jgi:fatty acid amide hydrolase 2